MSEVEGGQESLPGIEGGAPPPADPTAGEPSGNGAAPKAWHAMIQDADLRGHPFVQKQKSVDDIVREAVTMLPMVGAEKVPKPPGDSSKWTEAQWDKHYAALGRPESPEAYGLEPGELPEGMPWDADVQAKLVQAMHKAGLSKRAAATLFGEYKAVVAEQWSGAQSQAMEQRAAAEKALRKQWGVAYDAKLQNAHQAFQALAGDAADSLSTLALSDGTRLGDHPQFVEMMARVGDTIGEDTQAGKALGVSGRQFSMTPEEAVSAIRKFEFENQVALFQKEHPLHDQIIKQRDALYRVAYPDEEV